MTKFITMAVDDVVFDRLKEAKGTRSWVEFITAYSQLDPRSRLQMDISLTIEDLKTRIAGQLKDGYMTHPLELMKAISINLSTRARKNSSKLAKRVAEDLNRIMDYLTEEKEEVPEG